jgi:hypothetical protein
MGGGNREKCGRATAVLWSLALSTWRDASMDSDSFRLDLHSSKPRRAARLGGGAARDAKMGA